MGRHRIYDDETRREKHRAAQRAWYARQKAARPPRPPRVAPETKAKAVEMVRAGQSINSVARVLGYSPSAVWRWCRRNGIASRIRKHAPEPAPKPPSGEHEETGRSRRAYLAKLMREALPGAIRAAREKMRRLEDSL